MTIEIKKPELEALIKQRLESGPFQNVEDVLLDALRSTPEGKAVHGTRRKKTRAEAVVHIREIRRGVSLNGLKIKDLINEGRP